jgi:hypothetical protein
MDFAMRSGTFRGEPDLPLGWSRMPREQLPEEELQECGTITWDVPKVEVEALLGGAVQDCHSPPQYLAGTGLHLVVKAVTQPDGSTEVGVSLVPCDFEQHGVVLASASKALACQLKIQCAKPGQAEAVTVFSKTATYSKLGWGTAHLFTLTTPADLEPHLVEGHLKLTASCKVLCATSRHGW